MGPLVTQDGVNATCTLHGGQYRILFARNATVHNPAAAQVVQQPVALGGTVPMTHVPAPMASPMGQPIAQPSYDEIPLADPVPGAGGTAAPQVMCRVHPTMPAVAYCRTCGAPSCNTCNFVFPGGLNLCAACATKPPEALNPKRKKLLVWSYVMGIWTTIGLVVLMSGVLAPKSRRSGDAEAVGVLIEIFIFLPSIVGTALGWASMDKRLGNPGWVWGAAIWNSIILTILIALTVIGLTMH